MSRWIAEVFGSLTATMMLSLWLVLPVAYVFFIGPKNDEKQKWREVSLKDLRSDKEKYERLDQIRKWRSGIEDRTGIIAID